MRILGILFVLLAGYSAKADVCITGSNLDVTEASFDFNNAIMDGAELYAAAYKCQNIKKVSNGLTVASLTLQTSAIVAACTGAGLPATVALEGGVIVISFIDMIVSNLDCEDDEQKAELQKKVDDAVCEALEAQGIECIPPLKVIENNVEI